MQRHLILAAAASVAVVSTASAQLTTDDLVYNFDADTAVADMDWQSSAPASNTVALFDTAGAGRDAELVSVTTGRTFN